MFRSSIWLLALSSCTYINNAQYQLKADPDGDGATGAADCAPEDPTRRDMTEGYSDLDGDGFGGAVVTVCGRLDGVTQVAIGGDCDDGDDRVSPVADEVCNGIDDDCDGVFDGSDPGLLGGIVYYEDADGDGAPGLGGDPVLRCEAPAGHAAAPADGVWDCDDDDASIGPAATEVCDGVDNNCVDGVDEGLPLINGYIDGDDDGFGSPDEVVLGCALPAGFVLDASDCDDSNPLVSPGASERCANGVDDNCDGELDEAGAVGGLQALVDADLDGAPSETFEPVCAFNVGFIDPLLGLEPDCDDAASGRSAWRSEVVPKPPQTVSPEDESPLTRRRIPASSHYKTWAALLYRVFGVAGWRCPQCGEPMRLRAHAGALSTEPILEGLQRSARGPPGGQVFVA